MVIGPVVDEDLPGFQQLTYGEDLLSDAGRCNINLTNRNQFGKKIILFGITTKKSNTPLRVSAYNMGKLYQYGDKLSP